MNYRATSVESIVRGILIAIAAGAAVDGRARAQANCLDWSQSFGNPGVAGSTATAYSYGVYDSDGSGPVSPVLVMGGQFTSVGGIAASRIARWNGSNWAPLGSGMSAGAIVYALATFDDGSGPALYAAGTFNSAGGTSAANVARWNGSTWTALGAGLNNVAFCLTVFDDGSGPALFAGGQFTTAGGAAANRVARWNGVAWSAVGTGCDNTVYALTPFDDGSGLSLFAGGTFVTAGGSSARNIARWNGASWSSVGGGVDGAGRVQSLAEFDADGIGPLAPTLTAGGLFASVGGVAAQNIARWTGSSWQGLGAGTNNVVNRLVVFDEGAGTGDALYAGGQFTTAGAVSAACIARWNGSAWSTLGVGLSGGASPFVWTLAVFDDQATGGADLYAGGRFTQAAASASSGIAQWRGCAPLLLAEPASKSCPMAAPTRGSCKSCGDGDHSATLYAFSGEAIQSVVDLRIPGRGLDLIIARKYRSRIGPATAQGAGWDFSYNIRLEAAGPNLLLFDGNSRGDTYVSQGNGSWAHQEFFRSIAQSGDGSFTLTFADTGTWNFLPLTHPTAPGKLESIIDHNGNAIHFAYDAQGRLAVIRDTFDSVTNPRPISLAYNSEGLLTSITDWTGRQVAYDYYGAGDAGGCAGDLKSVTTPAVIGTPNGNDYPNGKTTVYTYSCGAADERLNHNLRTITDPKGQTSLTNVYASTQNPTDVTFDRVVRQIWGTSGDIIDYVYVPQSPSAANNFAVSKTITNDRVGNVSESFFDANNRQVMLREYTGRAPDPDSPTADTVNRPVDQLRPDDPPYFETRWEYSGSSLVTRVVHPNLNEELFTYDESNANPRARGNLLQHCKLPGPLGGDQTQNCESFEYDEGFGGCCGTNYVSRHEDSRGNETLHQYDSQGNRIHTTHRIASIVEDWEYNGAGQLTAHILPDNGSAHRRRDEFTYYDSGVQSGFLKEQIVDATGFALTTTYEYDSLGRGVRTVDPRGNDTLYVYNQLGQLVRTRSRQVTSGGGRYDRDLFYDANDNLARIDVQNVDDQELVVASNPYFTTIHDFDVLNRTTRTCQEKGSYAVPASQLTCAGLSTGEFITTEFAYDENGNRTLVRFGESTNGNQPGNVVVSRYDERDRVFRETRGAGSPSPSTNQSDYDGNGNISRTHAGLEDQPHVTLVAHDGFDRRMSKTDAMGNVESYHFDANGNRISIRLDGQLVDVAGSAGNQRLSEVSYAYDAMDRQTMGDAAFFDTASGAPIGNGHAITEVFYSANSQVIEEGNEDGHGTLATYDTANRLATTTDAKGNTVAYTYDNNANVVSSSSTEKSDLGAPDQVFVTTRAYDNLDRPTSVTDSTGNTTGGLYDSRGNRTRLIDALGEQTAFVYDGASRRLQTIRDMNGNGPAASDPVDIVTAQAWDDSSRLIEHTDDNGNTTVTLYDALDRRIAVQYADGTAQTLGLDVHGSMIQLTDANGSVVVATYDALDRLTHKAITPGPGVSKDTTFESFQYSGLSLLIRAEDDDSVVTRGYDSMFDITRETLNGVTTTCEYDEEGNAVGMVYPGGRTITCTYDELHRKTTIADQDGMIAEYSYRGPDRVERREYGNETRSDYEYDGVAPNPVNDFGVKKLVRTTHSRIRDGAVLDDRAYKWDRIGNKTQRADIRALGPMLVHDYSYDADDHMVQSVRTPPGGVIAYSLDGVGNRTAVVGGSLPGAYSMQSTLREPADFQMNQYTVTPRGVHSYDRQGNLKSVGSGSGPRLTYDYRNRLVAYRAGVSGGQPNSDKGFFAYHYKYDAIGRRTAKVLPAMAVPGQAITSLYYYYDWQLIEERSSVGVNVSYVHGNYIDEVLTMRTSDVDYYYHSDDNHNVMAMSDASGLVVERYEYGDYGAPKFYNAVGAALDTSGIGNRHLFTGREYDGESGLYFYRTRYFDPLDGRFIGRDMIGIWGDRINVGNGYAYIANNPWSGVDPLGLSHNLWHKITEKIEDVIEDVIDELEETAEEIEDAAEEVGEAIVKGVIWISLLPHLVLEATLDLATLPSRLVAWTINSALAGDPTPTRYGQWCGKGSLGGAAIDELDSCCEAHDDCAHSWDAAVSLSWKARACNLALCNCAAKAVCKTDECRAFKNSVLIVFCRDHFGIDCIGNWLP